MAEVRQIARLCFVRFYELFEEDGRLLIFKIDRGQQKAVIKEFEDLGLEPPQMIIKTS
jgi:hypothetical protein